MTPPFDERLFSHPARFALVFVVVFAVLFGLLVFALFGIDLLPSLSTRDTISDALTGLLALGTSALAYSAGLQAQHSKAQAQSTEKTRVDNMRPHLSIRIYRELSAPGTSSQPTVTMNSPFFLAAPDKGLTSLKFAVRNMGPGNAVRVWVWAVTWPVEDRLVWKTQTNFEPATEEPNAYNLCVMNEALKANEDHVFELAVLIGRPPGAVGAPAVSYLLRQVVLQARCEDVEGRPQTTVRKGVTLRLLVPKPSRTPTDLPPDRGATGAGYELLWDMMREEDIDRAPLGKDPEGLFR